MVRVTLGLGLSVPITHVADSLQVLEEYQLTFDRADPGNSGHGSKVSIDYQLCHHQSTIATSSPVTFKTTFLYPTKYDGISLPPLLGSAI